MGLGFFVGLLFLVWGSGMCRAFSDLRWVSAGSVKALFPRQRRSTLGFLLEVKLKRVKRAGFEGCVRGGGGYMQHTMHSITCLHLDK